MLDLLGALVLLPAVLLVEEGLPAFVLGEVQGPRWYRRGTRAALVGTAQEAHDAVDPAELLEIQPRQIDEGIADQEREPFL